MDANRWFRRLTLAVLAAAMLQNGGVGAELIAVGGKQGWNPNVNYTDWVSNQSFHLGDWLRKQGATITGYIVFFRIPSSLDHDEQTRGAIEEDKYLRIYIHKLTVFRFNKYMYDVLEVNQTSYEQCNPQGFLKNVTRGGRDVLELNQTGTLYFICSKGYCFGGMKVAINVVEAQEPASLAPPPNRNGVNRRRLSLGGNHCVVVNVMLGFVIALVLLFAF